AEKLADRFGPDASFEAEDKQNGDHQADEPGAAFWRIPQPRLRVVVSAIDRLEVTMHAAFGKSSSFGKASNALLTIFTNRVENQKTFGPQSHIVGPCPERWLKSCRNSAFQGTRSTIACPVLGGYPREARRSKPQADTIPRLEKILLPEHCAR